MVQNKGTYHPDLIKINLTKEKSHTTQSVPSCHIKFKEREMSKKNKDKTFIEIMEECIHHSKEALWNYTTALRGPDIIVAFGETHRWVKIVFTCPLRGRGISYGVEEYLVSWTKHIENMFKYLNDEKCIYEYFHYLNHIAKIWHYFNPKVEHILYTLFRDGGDLNEEQIKDLARKYKKYVDEWLNCETVINQKDGGGNDNAEKEQR